MKVALTKAMNIGVGDMVMLPADKDTDKLEGPYMIVDALAERVQEGATVSGPVVTKPGRMLLCEYSFGEHGGSYRQVYVEDFYVIAKVQAE